MTMAMTTVAVDTAAGAGRAGRAKVDPGRAAPGDEATAKAVRKALVRSLRRLYRAHGQGSGQARENSKLATSPDLREQLSRGSRMNQDQATRLERVFRVLGRSVGGAFDPAMQGVIDDNKAANIEATDALTLDLTLIASGQLAAHRCIAAYGTLRSYCEVLDEWEAARLLGDTLRETLAFDEQLTALARRAIIGLARPPRPARDPDAPRQRRVSIS